MGLLKGQNVGGVQQVNQNVRFMKALEIYNAWQPAWYVDGTNGADTNGGSSMTSAFATIGAAVSAAKQGAIIYVRPKAYVAGTGFGRYTETVTIPVTAVDLSIIGVTNSLHPDFGPKMQWTGTAVYALNAYGPALHVENMGFRTDTTATGCVKLWNDGASHTQSGTEGTTFYNCVFREAYPGIKVLSGGTGIVIQNCNFQRSANIDISCSANPGLYLQILGCKFLSDNGAASSTTNIIIVGPMSDMLIADNYFDQVPATAKYIIATGTNNGILANNHFNKADVHVTNDLTLGGLLPSGNTDGTTTFVA